MILRRITAGARNIASGVLMLCGALSHAKAQDTVEQDTSPVLVNAAAGDVAKREIETTDVVVRQRGIASWYAERGAGAAPPAGHGLTTAQ
jgi:hypothetical protein